MHTNLKEYSTFRDALKNLFFASFGEFDFDAQEKSRLGSTVGLGFLITFLIINIGLFMSLFVAIITALFQ